MTELDDTENKEVKVSENDVKNNEEKVENPEPTVDGATSTEVEELP